MVMHTHRPAQLVMPAQKQWSCLYKNNGHACTVVMPAQWSCTHTGLHNGHAHTQACTMVNSKVVMGMLR